MIINPFEVTKAVDFTDDQIAANWVDLRNGGFDPLINPRSPMPKFIIGAKGGGRTHVLRYYSYALQRIRNRNSVVEGIRNDGYLGIYFRCTGLDSNRFASKGQSDDTWLNVFSYYTEILFSRLALNIILEICGAMPSDDGEKSFVREVASLFDVSLDLNLDGVEALKHLIDAFADIQKSIDIAINNAARTKTLNVDIKASSGRLVFGIPQAAHKHLSAFEGITFAYLIDEFENLTETQQRYVNTLIREKQLPSTFLVGSRRHGLRTQMTLSADEVNRKGSEYDLIVLEDAYRADSNSYSNFCQDIVRRRLSEYLPNIEIKKRLGDYFEEDARPLEIRARAYMEQDRSVDDLSPWLVHFKNQLSASAFPGDIRHLVSLVQFQNDPLYEKFAVFLLYRAWADKQDLLPAAEEIRVQIQRKIAGGEFEGSTLLTFNHYKHDLFAQLLADLRISQDYYGFNTFIDLTAFIPRNLLVILKQITRWSMFFGENAFQETKISLKAQNEGIREASAWFLRENKGLGRDGEYTQIAIRRLAGLFRAMRFSDKPVEVSCATFETDRQGLTADSTRILDDAVKYGLLLDVPTGRRERNTQTLQYKYQLNPMIVPLFDLPFSRRGSANFTSSELNVIFDPSADESAYNSMQKRIISRLNAPFADPTDQIALTFD